MKKKKASPVSLYLKTQEEMNQIISMFLIKMEILMSQERLKERLNFSR